MIVKWWDCPECQQGNPLECDKCQDCGFYRWDSPYEPQELEMDDATLPTVERAKMYDRMSDRAYEIGATTAAEHYAGKANAARKEARRQCPICVGLWSPFPCPNEQAR